MDVQAEEGRLVKPKALAPLRQQVTSEASSSDTGESEEIRKEKKKKKKKEKERDKVDVTSSTLPPSTAADGSSHTRKPSPPPSTPSEYQGYVPPQGSAQARAIAAALAARAALPKMGLRPSTLLRPKSSKKKTKNGEQMTPPSTQTPPPPPESSGKSSSKEKGGEKAPTRQPSPPLPVAPSSSKYAVTDSRQKQQAIDIPGAINDTQVTSVRIHQHNNNPGTTSSPQHHIITVRPSDDETVNTITGEALDPEYAIHFYPRMNTPSHMENYFIVESFIHLFCCGSQTKRERQSTVLFVNKWVSIMSPVLGLLWCLAMVMSLAFFTDQLPSKYFYLLLFCGLYPFIRFGSASVPILKLLLSSFETWFLLAQVVLLVVSFGALVHWNMKFAFTAICLSPGLFQMILLDANLTSIGYSSFAMFFGAGYMVIFTILLGTGRIVDEDVILKFEYFTVSLIDFTNTRILTLVLFLLKNIIMLMLNPNSYIQLKSRVFKTYTHITSNRVSIA